MVLCGSEVSLPSQSPKSMDPKLFSPKTLDDFSIFHQFFHLVLKESVEIPLFRRFLGELRMSLPRLPALLLLRLFRSLSAPLLEGGLRLAMATVAGGCPMTLLVSRRLLDTRLHALRLLLRLGRFQNLLVHRRFVVREEELSKAVWFDDRGHGVPGWGQGAGEVIHPHLLSLLEDPVHGLKPVDHCHEPGKTGERENIFYFA